MLKGKHTSIARIVSETLIVAAVNTPLLCAADAARAGPCTAQIAQVEQQIHKAQAAASPGGAGTPSAPQSIGAQLHHQPTAQSIEQAQNMAAARAAAAIERARKADAEGDAQACAGALNDAKQLYGLQ